MLGYISGFFYWCLMELGLQWIMLLVIDLLKDLFEVWKIQNSHKSLYSQTGAVIRMEDQLLSRLSCELVQLCLFSSFNLCYAHICFLHLYSLMFDIKICDNVYHASLPFSVVAP